MLERYSIRVKALHMAYPNSTLGILYGLLSTNIIDPWAQRKKPWAQLFMPPRKINLNQTIR